MRRKRKYIGLEVRLAAALLGYQRWGWAAPIPFQQSKTMTAKQIIRCFTFDHYPIPHAHGGSDHPSNLCPRLCAVHKIKTATVDIPMIAKVKRVSDAHKDFVRWVLGPVKRKKRHTSRWPKRKFRSRP